jgi:hypothetical protein
MVGQADIFHVSFGLHHLNCLPQRLSVLPLCALHRVVGILDVNSVMGRDSPEDAGKGAAANLGNKEKGESL